MIGIALEQVFLRHAVEGDEDHLRLEGELRQFLLHRGDQGIDIDRIVMIGRRDAHARLPAHVHQRPEGLIAGGGRGRSGILRVERHQENAVAALVEQGLDALAHLRLAVAHGPIDRDLVARDGLQVLGDLLGLVAGDGLERALVALVVPDRRVIAALGAGALGEDDEVEDRPPQEARSLDDAPVGEKLLQVAAHRPVARCPRACPDSSEARRSGPALAGGWSTGRTPWRRSVRFTLSFINKPLGRRVRRRIPLLDAALDKRFRPFRQSKLPSH